MRYIVLVVSLLGRGAMAQGSIASSPSFEALYAAAERPGSVFDGKAARAKGPLDVLSEEKNVLLKPGEFVKGHNEWGHDGLDAIDHCQAGTDHCSPGTVHRTPRWVPDHLEETRGDVTTLRVRDRAGYKDQEGLKYGAIGAGVGLLGFLALLAGPIGWALGACAVAAGAIIGRTAGRASAASTPEIFTEISNKHTVSTPV